MWTHHLGGAPNEILASGDRLFVGSKDNTFYCLKAQDGSVDWPVVTGADVIGLPAIDARNVYFVSLDNVLRAVHRGNGNQDWKRALAVRPTAGPVQAADVMLVTSVSKTLPAFARHERCARQATRRRRRRRRAAVRRVRAGHRAARWCSWSRTTC